ncbi:MAG: hypothetical protein ACOZCL_01440 [Bacillota bacterium]
MKVPELLTPDVVKALAENAPSLKGIISSGDEIAALGCGAPSGSCCPKLVKIKNILSLVEINNYNAASGPPFGGPPAADA